MSPSLSRRLVRLVPLALLALPACTGEPDDGGGSVVLDSAGVEIVSHAATEWAEAPVWRLDAEPMLAIGVVEGDPAYQLSRVSGALRLADGTIVVANGGSSELRFFDAEGAHLRSVGRQGEGPGEYGFLRMLARYGADSLLVWDPPLKRGTILGNDGTFGRTFPGPEDRGGFVYMLDSFDDGSLLASYDAGHDPARERPGVLRASSDYLHFSPSGQLDTIGRFATSEVYVTGQSSMGLPFGPRAVAATSGRMIYFGPSDSYEIRTLSLAGQLVRILRGDRSVPVTRQDIDALTAQITDPARRRTFAEIPYPETMPAYSEMHVDSDGNLWVGDYLRPGEEEQRWTIFGPEGDLLATLVTPPRFTVFEIGSDYLLGEARDELDVERVQLHRLVRGDTR